MYEGFSLLADVVIRQALPSDIPEIVALWQALQATNAAYEPRLAPNNRAADWFADYLQGQLDNGDSAIYVAAAENAIVGYIFGQTLRRPTLNSGDCGYIADVCVVDSRRGEGIGRSLFMIMRDWFHARGLRAIEVQTVRANPASQAFWRKMGFADFLRTLRGDF
jgi:GNAT superfamily N-acetyltransferase